MSYSKVKSLRPRSPTSDPLSAKQPITINSTADSSPVPANSGKNVFYRKRSDGSVSDASTHNLVGGKLTEAGRLTPTCPGRVKAPPVCRDKALKRVASTIQDIECHSPEDAERCAEKCLAIAGGNNEMDVDNIPFNFEVDLVQNQPVPPVDLPIKDKPTLSSSSTVVTNTSAFAVTSSVSTVPGSGKKDPPLKVVRTDDCVLNSEDEAGVVGEKTKTLPSPPQSPKQLPSSFTDKLIKDAQSRQGRSLQRWLVHSQSESLVRQVAGCVPITRDGRIVLVSASRKNEWILPKGGWDSDETKEECAVRETYEEAGLLGKLGSCMAPIDYESGKSKKRRMEISKIPELGSDGQPLVTKKAKGESKEFPTQSESSPGHGPESPKLSFIRLLLFPLYLTEVKSDWPEKGRLRKLVDIDEAISIMDKENRLYFKKGLEMVKEMGLHLVHKQAEEKGMH